MTIAVVCRPIADASVSLAAAYGPIAVELWYTWLNLDVGIEIYELTLLTVVHS